MTQKSVITVAFMLMCFLFACNQPSLPGVETVAQDVTKVSTVSNVKMASGIEKQDELFLLTTIGTQTKNNVPYANIPTSCCLNIPGVKIPNLIQSVVIENRGNDVSLQDKHARVNTHKVPGVFHSNYVKKRIARN